MVPVDKGGRLIFSKSRTFITFDQTRPENTLWDVWVHNSNNNSNISQLPAVRGGPFIAPTLATNAVPDNPLNGDAHLPEYRNAGIHYHGHHAPTAAEEPPRAQTNATAGATDAPTSTFSN